MLDTASSPTTADEFSAQLQGLKEGLLARIAGHFAAHPAPITNRERPKGSRKSLPLLDYHVTTTEESQAFIMELRAEGFRYKTNFENNGREGYATLGVEALIDLVRVLEKTTATMQIPR